jgi:hypothetical protein
MEPTIESVISGDMRGGNDTWQKGDLRESLSEKTTAVFSVKERSLLDR